MTGARLSSKPLGSMMQTTNHDAKTSLPHTSLLKREAETFAFAAGVARDHASLA